MMSKEIAKILIYQKGKKKGYKNQASKNTKRQNQFFVYGG
jgi:hypothetical protein